MRAIEMFDPKTNSMKWISSAVYFQPCFVCLGEVGCRIDRYSISTALGTSGNLWTYVEGWVIYLLLLIFRREGK